MLIMTFGCFMLLLNPLTSFSVIISGDRLSLRQFIFVTTRVQVKKYFQL